MLPIALTCPVWWVARWTARMLASLAVVLACSFGAATLPVGPAAAHAATAPRAALDGPTLAPRHSATVPVVRHSATAPAARFARQGGVAGARPADQGTRFEASERYSRAADSGPIGPLSPVATGSVGRRVAEATPADRRPVLAGAVPATVGSRAPPAR